ncbi:MAG: fumarate hydrolyase [Anaerolinea sp. 4484_236]|nr:MAG: fumarate hydrolyase [Anaerolinea sp. 4484_236]
MKKLTLPISDEAIRNLKVGETVLLSGVMMTGRDAVHKWMNDAFIAKKVQPTEDDLAVYEAIKPILNGGIIYHCGPVVSGVETGDYKFVAAGPTTSIREEPYQALVMEHFNLKGVIGKGGMAAKTLKGCQDTPAVYFHAIGGAASLIAQSVQEVITVHKLDFGVPEAIWVIDVKDFPVVVTMDSHGNSQHVTVEERSQEVLAGLMQKA